MSRWPGWPRRARMAARTWCRSRSRSRLGTAAPGAGTAAPAGPGDRIYSAVNAKPKSRTDLARLRNIRADPRVCVLADHYEDDWDRLWWVRGDGRATILDDPAAMAPALELLAGRYRQYRERPPRRPGDQHPGRSLDRLGRRACLIACPGLRLRDPIRVALAELEHVHDDRDRNGRAQHQLGNHMAAGVPFDDHGQRPGNAPAPDDGGPPGQAEHPVDLLERRRPPVRLRRAFPRELLGERHHRNQGQDDQPEDDSHPGRRPGGQPPSQCRGPQ